MQVTHSHCHTRVMTTTVQCGSTATEEMRLPHLCEMPEQTRQAAWKRQSCCVTSWAHREHQRTGREDGSEAQSAQGRRPRPRAEGREAAESSPLSGQENRRGSWHPNGHHTLPGHHPLQPALPPGMNARTTHHSAAQHGDSREGHSLNRAQGTH